MKYGLELWKESSLNPLVKEMTTLHSEFDRWMDSLLAKSKLKELFSPQCDLEETNSNFVFKFDVPGMEKENIKVEVMNNQLVVSGERKDETTKDTKYRHIEERYQGRFQRIFTLPPNADPRKIEADYKSGVLKVTVAKTSEEKPRQIKVGEKAQGESKNVAIN